MRYTMFNKLSKKYGLLLKPFNDSLCFYNENLEKFYVEPSNPNLEKIKNIYIKEIADSKERLFYSYLNDKTKSLNGYYFFILKVKNYNYEIKEFINEVVDGAIILEYSDYLIVLHKNHLEMDPKTLSNSLNEDFYLNVQTFEGFKLDSFNDLIYVFVLYRYYLRNKSLTNLKDLILSIVNKNSKELINLKPIVLKKLNNDFQIEKIINGMFDNNLNVSKTSNSVYMHRNTINNKIELIKDETSLDVQKFKDAMALYFLINSK